VVIGISLCELYGIDIISGSKYLCQHYSSDHVPQADITYFSTPSSSSLLSSTYSSPVCKKLSSSFSSKCMYSIQPKPSTDQVQQGRTVTVRRRPALKSVHFQEHQKPSYLRNISQPEYWFSTKLFNYKVLEKKLIN
jgi:hypothetical protein